MPDTGFPRADVEDDFQRARRRQTLARLAHWLRLEPDDVNLILPFDEVVAALGMTGERKLGLQVIKLDTVVGTVDSSRDFDRRFRPTSGRVADVTGPHGGSSHSGGYHGAPYPRARSHHAR